MVSTYGERLGQAMRFAKKERKDLAHAIGTTVQAVGAVINGKTTAFTTENNANAAAFLKINAYWLATGKGEMLPCVTSEAPQTSVASLEQALEIVSRAMLLSDELTLDQVRPLLVRLVDQPSRYSEITHRIGILLGKR